MAPPIYSALILTFDSNPLLCKLDVTLDHVDPNLIAGEVAILVRLRVSALPTTGEAPRWPTSATAHGGHVSVRLRPVALGLGHGLIETLQTGQCCICAGRCIDLGLCTPDQCP